MSKRRDVRIGVGKQGDDLRHGMSDEARDKPRIGTVAADKAYNTKGFVAQLRQINATPHLAQNIERNGGSVIDGRATRHLRLRAELFNLRESEDVLGHIVQINVDYFTPVDRSLIPTAEREAPW